MKINNENLKIIEKNIKQEYNFKQPDAFTIEKYVLYSNGPNDRVKVKLKLVDNTSELIKILEEKIYSSFNINKKIPGITIENFTTDMSIYNIDENTIVSYDFFKLN